MDVDINRIKGIYREQWMEWLQRMGISNTYQVPSRVYLDIPYSINMTRRLLEELIGVDANHFLYDVFDQYNEGRRPNSVGANSIKAR